MNDGNYIQNIALTLWFLKEFSLLLFLLLGKANLLGPNPPPTPSLKVANIPVLQPPPPSTRPPRTSPLPRSSSSLSRHNRSGDSNDSAGRSPEKNTAHVRPFTAETRVEGMGNVRGASSNWRPISTTGRVDLLAGQRNQLQHYSRSSLGAQAQQQQSLNESFGSNHSSETYGSREQYGTARSSNAMEINKIAQCSKMVPAMSGSEIRSALTAVNWDTVSKSFLECLCRFESLHI